MHAAPIERFASDLTKTQRFSDEHHDFGSVDSDQAHRHIFSGRQRRHSYRSSQRPGLLIVLFGVTSMIVLAGVFLLLFAGWVLWAWTVAEGYDVKWLRVVCAKLFVALVFALGVGTGVVATRIQLTSQLRADVRDFATVVRTQLQSGDRTELARQLDTVVQPPDEWSTESEDLLKRMTAVTDRLRQPATPTQSQIAERPQPIPLQ